MKSIIDQLKRYIIKSHPIHFNFTIKSVRNQPGGRIGYRIGNIDFNQVVGMELAPLNFLFSLGTGFVLVVVENKMIAGDVEGMNCQQKYGDRFSQSSQ